MSSKGDKSTETPPTGVAVTVTQPTPEQIAAQTQLQEIQARIDALENQITETIEGQRQWTETTLSPLKQEIADLKATLATIPSNLTAQFSGLRAELTQQLQELQAELKAPPPPPPDPPTISTETPPGTPPEPEPVPPPSEGVEGREKTVAPAKAGKRVI